MTRSLSLILLALPVTGCSRGDAPLDRPARVYVTPEAVLTSFGSLSDTTGAEVRSRIKAAVLSESGRYLAVADRSPAYLRIFDRESGATRSFGPEGGGPGELRAADAVEFLGDSVLLVLARGCRLEGFDGNGDGVLLWDRAQTPHEGYWLPCDGDSAGIWSRWSAEEIEVESEPRRSSGGTGGQALTLPDTLFAGAAARGAAKI